MPPFTTFTGAFSGLIQPIQVFFHFLVKFLSSGNTPQTEQHHHKNSKKALATLAKIKKSQKAKKAIDKAGKIG